MTDASLDDILLLFISQYSNIFKNYSIIDNTLIFLPIIQNNIMIIKISIFIYNSDVQTLGLLID